MHSPFLTGSFMLLLAVMVAGWSPAVAQAADEPEPLGEETQDDTQSGSLDDSTGSIESAHDPLMSILYSGWRKAGDFRFGFVRSEFEERDGSDGTNSNWQARLRFGGEYRLRDWLLLNGRFVVGCTSKECDPDLSLDPSPSKVETADPGTVTFDELYLHAFRTQRFDVALGRLQTKFVTRAGVYAKSLDRNNSNAFNINWTDGIQLTYHLPNKSIVHFITEYNDRDGASNVRRGPLDFTRSSTRYSYFMAWESLQRSGPLIQRGVDLTFLPSALLADGTLSGPRDDYIGIVTRVAAARPFGDKDRRWNVSAEVGYAPETPTKASLNLPGDGDVDGLATAVTASIMDLWPRHSIGLNYARTDAGWLLSPQYPNGEELFEVRWLWRRDNGSTVEARMRWRDELDRQINQAQKRDEFDFFARITFGF